MDLDGLVWRKSSRCESNGCVSMATRKSDSDCETGACVEVSKVDGMWLMRQSANPSEVLKFTQAEWDAFVAGVLDHEFDV